MGCFNDFFPLYMAVIIAFKKPSEMTNSIMGALSLSFFLELFNFAEAMRVTDFWHSLGNSVLITALTVLCHSGTFYEDMPLEEIWVTVNFINTHISYIVSGMFVPFAIL